MLSMNLSNAIIQAFPAAAASITTNSGILRIAQASLCHGALAGSVGAENVSITSFL